MAKKSWHRYVLVATPADDSWVAHSLAEIWNADRQTFFWRAEAQRAANYYERVLKMPVQFWIRRIEELQR